MRSKQTSFLSFLVLVMAYAAVPAFSAEPYINWKIDFDDASTGANQGYINVNLGQDGFWSKAYSPTVQWRLKYQNDTDFKGVAIQYKYVSISIDSTKAPGPGVVTNELNGLKPGVNYVLAHIAYVNKFMAADAPKAVCNENRQALLNQGQSLADILAKTHVINITGSENPKAHLSVSYQASENGPTLSTSRNTDLPLRVRCYGNANIAKKFLPSNNAAGAVATAEPFKVLSAGLAVSPAISSGTCPKELTLALTFTTNKQGPVQVRVKSTQGWVSKVAVYNANMYSQAKGVWFGEAVEKLLMPTPGPGGSGGGVSPGSSTEGIPQPGGDTFPGGQSATPFNQGNAYAGNTPANVHQGGLQLAVTANGQTVYSPGWKAYKVTCLPGVAVGAAALPSQQVAAPTLPPTQPGSVASNLKSDITTHGVTLNGGFISGGPVISISANQAKAKTNGQCQFEMAYHMINKGEVATAPGFRNRLLRNGVPVIQHDNQLLAAKQSQVKTFNVYLQPGLNDFGLYLDVDKQVAESDETNNFRVAKINLTGSCLDKVLAPNAPAAPRGIQPGQDFRMQQRPSR